jgi:hypothetical protein
MKRRVPLLILGGFLLSISFVPFRHRTLVSTSEGGFAFEEERLWGSLWNQPTPAAGVAEYPFLWFLGIWLGLAVIGLVSRSLARRGNAGDP